MINGKLNEITIEYKIDNQNSINLFGKKFIENNKNNCKILIENEEIDINEYFKISKELKKKNY